MSPYIAYALATAHIRDLQRAAGCYPALIEHRRTAARARTGSTRLRLQSVRADRAGRAAACCA